MSEIIDKEKERSKAEKFIQEHTNNCFNYNSYAQDPIPWLTPDEARSAVEIAKEETIEKACYVIRHKYGHYHYLKGDITEDLIREFRKAMKDEAENI